MLSILWILFFVLFPALIIYLCEKFPVMDKIGPVILCYAIGIVIGNVGILPEDFSGKLDLLTTVTVPLALPLMFFSMDIRRWGRLAGRTLLSFVLASLAVAIASGIAYFIFRDKVGGESWKIAGMLIGCYTGGTPNLAAIGTALKVDTTSYIAVHASDVVVSAIYLMILISVFPRILPRILPRYKPVMSTEADTDTSRFSDTFMDFKKKDFLPLLRAFGLAVLILAIGGGLSFILPQSISMTVTILVITTLGILSSLIPAVRNTRMTFQLGHYFILIFSLVVSSMANIRDLVLSAPAILGYVATIVALSSLIHLVFSTAFRIDSDTHIITSTALVFSPPFVPMVAAALKNREIVITGVIIGIGGWMVGNYMGITIAYLLQSWGG